MNARLAKASSLYEEILNLPENLYGEILNGELTTQPRPTGRHGIAQRGLNLDLAGPFDFGRGGPGGWWILSEPEVHFARDIEIAVPDLAGWRRECMPKIPEDQRFEIVPNWLCEILSPSTEKRDRSVKMPIYARYGVSHAWLVDPLKRTLEAFELRDGSWQLVATRKHDDAVRIAPFDAISFCLADLWV